MGYRKIRIVGRHRPHQETKTSKGKDLYGSILQSLALLISAIALMFSIYHSARVRVESEKSTFKTQVFSLRFSLLRDFIQDIEELRAGASEAQIDSTQLPKYLASINMISRVYDTDSIAIYSDSLLVSLRDFNEDSDDLRNIIMLVRHSDLLVNQCYNELYREKSYFDSLRVF